MSDTTSTAVSQVDRTTSWVFYQSKSAISRAVTMPSVPRLAPVIASPDRSRFLVGSLDDGDGDDGDVLLSISMSMPREASWVDAVVGDAEGLSESGARVVFGSRA